MKTGEKVFIGGVAIGLALTAVVLVSQPAKAAPGTVTVKGVVLDQIGPLPGVKVTIDGRATMTAGDGTFVFTSVVPGVYSMSFSKAGYETRYL